MALDTPTAVVLELMTMAQQSAAHLGELLMAASLSMAAERGQALIAEILRCCDRVIAAISMGATGKKRKVMLGGVMPAKRRARCVEPRREVQSGTTADGFMWRKYGQKDINGSKHPRFYYRCAYSGEGCGATRRVQQSQEDPAAFVIAYYGEHTCGDCAGYACQQGAAPLPPAAVIVDSNANAGGVVSVADRYQYVESPLPVLDAEQSDGAEAPFETSQGRSSSSSSSSSEAEPGTSPVLEFLEGGLGVRWKSVESITLVSVVMSLGLICFSRAASARYISRTIWSTDKICSTSVVYSVGG